MNEHTATPDEMRNIPLGHAIFATANGLRSLVPLTQLIEQAPTPEAAEKLRAVVVKLGTITCRRLVATLEQDHAEAARLHDEGARLLNEAIAMADEEVRRSLGGAE